MSSSASTNVHHSAVSKKSTDVATLFDFKAVVARQFADRPTLRHVLDTQLLTLLKKKYPVLSRVTPALTSSDALVLLVPDSSLAFWHRKPLLDIALQAMLDGTQLSLDPVDGRAFGLALRTPYLFSDESDRFEYLPISGSDAGLDDLLLTLPEYWCQAQVDYWCAAGSAGASRDRWLQLVLKMALLQNLPLQNLDSYQQSLVHALLGPVTQPPSTFAVTADMALKGERFSEMQPGLLVTGEWDEREVVLWCLPSSVIRAFDSLDDFAGALGQALGNRHLFDEMTWHRQALEGDVFAQQAALMLEAMLARAQRCMASRTKTAADKESLIDALSDPAHWFIDGYYEAPARQALLPPGVANANPTIRFAYQDAVFEMALQQATSKRAGALEDIQDLRTYTREQVRQALLENYPDAVGFSSDDVLLQLALAQGMPGGAGTGTGGGEPLVPMGEKSLTDFAIGNLGSLHDSVITGVRYRNHPSPLPTLTADYLRSLIQQVDIGAHYPAYVVQSMDAPQGRAERVECFGKEWRQALLFSALGARADGKLGDVGLQVVTDYVRGLSGATTKLMPLAYTDAGQSSQYDVVHGMYVLKCEAPARVILYRPLYGHEAVREYDDIKALELGIRQSSSVRASVLQWMDRAARDHYHSDLSADSRLVHVGIDPGLLPEPAEVAQRFWLSDVDSKLYNANRDWLVAIAEKEAPSTARSRWEILEKSAWLLFQTAAPLMRGPVAAVAWLTQTIVSLSADIAAVKEGDEFEVSQAVVDLLLNVGMTLLHLRLPLVDLGPSQSLPGLVGELPGYRGNWKAPVEPTQGKVGLPGPLTDTELDFSWRGNAGFNWIAPQQREALRELRVIVDLDGIEPLKQGEARGLHEVDGRFYAVMANDIYPVGLFDGEVRIVDALGLPQAWIKWQAGAWRIDTAMRLAGGGPKTRRQLKHEENEREVRRLMDEDRRLITELNALDIVYKKHLSAFNKASESLTTLEAKVPRDDADETQLTVLNSLRSRARMRVVDDLKLMVEKGIAHDKVVTAIESIRVCDPALPDSITLQRNATREQLILHCEVYCNELTNLINDAQVPALIGQMAALPVSPEEIEFYRRTYSTLEAVIAWEGELLTLSRELDALLEDTLKDDSIKFKQGNKHAELTQIIEHRRLTTIDVAFRRLLDLAEASLDRLASVDEGVLINFDEYLAGPDLASAGAAHGDLAGSDLSLSERIDVLTGVVEAYDQAQDMSKYLASLGGSAVRPQRLQQYREALITLKKDATAALEEAIRELQLAEKSPLRPAVHAMRGGKRRVVKTQRGRSVVVQQREVDGEDVVQQVDSRGAVLKTFRPQGDDLLENVTPQVPQPATVIDSSRLIREGRKLVGEVELVIKMAKTYIDSDEPNGLSTVIDFHIEKLDKVKGQLSAVEPHHELLEQLEEGISRLDLSREDLLQALYLSTSHPSAESLRFLLAREQVTVARLPKRVQLDGNDFLDIYEVRRKTQSQERSGSGLWEVHLHYPAIDTPRRQFSKGHIKLWTQRKLGRNAQLRVGIERNELLLIYRGDVRLAQVEDLLPFD